MKTVIEIKEGESKVVDHVKITMKEGKLEVEIPDYKFTNFRESKAEGKSLIGYFDLILPNGMTVIGMKILNGNDGKPYIAAPSIRGSKPKADGKYGYFPTLAYNDQLAKDLAANAEFIIKQLTEKENNQSLITEMMLLGPRLAEELFAWKADNKIVSAMGVKFKISSTAKVVMGEFKYKDRDFRIIEQNDQKRDANGEYTEGAKLAQEGHKIANIYATGNQFICKIVDGQPR